MEFKELEQKAIAVRDAYSMLSRVEGFKVWGVNEHLQGLMGDLGDLSKLIMAKKGLWFAKTDVDAKLGHELADCLYAVMVIAEELGVDLEKEFVKNMKELNDRISDRRVIPQEGQ